MALSAYMRKLGRVAAGARAQMAFGGFLFLIMTSLTFMASRTGQEEFDEAKRRLDDIEASNFRLDGALSWSMFELRTDFDSITESQRGLRETVAAFEAAFADQGAELAEAVDRKLAIVEDFKTEHAVLRNSRAIAAQLIESLWEDEISPEDAAALFALEREFLNFMSRRDPSSAAQLRAAIGTARADRTLSRLSQWPAIEAHLETLIGRVEQVGQLMQRLFFVPIVPTIETQRAGLAERLAEASATAGRYRTALFAIAVVLLVFSGFMVSRARRYVRMIQRTNDQLEFRVADRTKELEEVNSALLAEISERENVEAQLQIARKLESIGQLAAGIAHEINTPTQYVSDNVAFLESVWKELKPLIDDYERLITSGEIDIERSRQAWDQSDLAYLRDEVPAAFAEASGGLEQISRIVLAVKTFSHPGSQGLQPSDVNRALESTVMIARNEWKYVAELELDLDPRLPAVPCNVSMLNQVVLNLVINAAQAIADGRKENELGHIRVSSKRRGDFAEIRVEDDGPGVPDPIRDRIFDPFFTTKEVGKGTGQGLAIAHRVIHQQHAGSLTLESNEGRGARFIIRLPLRMSKAIESAKHVPQRMTA